ncbi:hypothetical protein TTHERM_00348370 (macronuclear) [Tetrahymena thermophila SB210]|uniref:Uncharacterized protein n=1 Tax=Tetrahymena thermophila (strain SB210) TaxID=312017 RepID=I7LWS2_TETTS|nr:hypothetical protein TTHERM_00348370 [Tetrahymena thermophila SB210]EAS02747.2 hypothetical protein TTHERM_00348370 [Tetrahymena thermophila SB210]|eukprot:XP_001022992.2 hypothetical protein TTHERM_00348370 [Tetrahymena thermophila SB210]
MNNRSNLESQSPTRQQLKALLCELFLEIRTKLDEGSQIQLRRVVPIDEDKSVIMNADFSTVLHYINQISSYLINQKHELEQIIEKKNSDECSDYESCLQKLEAEVRQHIRIEQQLKLYAETTQEKLEQVTKEKDDLELKFKNVNLDQIKQIEKTNSQMIEQLNRKEEEYKQLQQQYNQKTDQLNEQEQTIQQLKAQVQQLQLSQQQQQNNHLTNSQWLQQQQQSSQPSFNSHLIQGDSTQSSKMVSVNPNLQSNQSNEISFIDAKRGKRSVSSMNEDTIKKYTQFSQSSQINPQQILSSSSQIQYNTQNKNLNSDQVGETQNARLYTDPHVQERSSSRLGNVGEMKENRKSFDKYASSIQEKLMKKEGQGISYYNENNSNNSNSGNLNNNSYKNIHNNMINSKAANTATTLTSAQQSNNRQNLSQMGSQKQTQNQVQMPIVSNSGNNPSMYLNAQKQKSGQQQQINNIAQQQQSYLQQSGVQYANIAIQQTQLYPSQISSQHSSTQQQQQQPNYISGSRVKYTHHQQNASASGLSQTNAIPQAANLNGTGSNQYEGSYQTLDSQRNKQALTNKLNDIQNCLSSRQPNSIVSQPQQYVQTSAYTTGLHVRNPSNQSASNINEKQNAMNSSYTQQHSGQYQYNQQQFAQANINNASNLNTSNIKYSPVTQQVSYTNTQQLQQNIDLNKSQRSYMNASSNNINNNNNNISMNQYSSKEQNNSTLNMNTSQINTSTNNNNNNNSNYKSSLSNNQINNTQISSNSKYGQFIQSQRPNSSFEKSNPYIQNQKPQQGIVGASNQSQNLSINNGQIAYQQSGSNNPRSQSMDGFQKQQQIINKQGNTQQIQNAYLKQKTSSQMQTAEVINNMIKNYKMN